LESGEQRLVGIAEQFGSGAWQWLRSLSASLPATLVQSSCVDYAAACLLACLLLLLLLLSVALVLLQIRLRWHVPQMFCLR